MRLREGALSGGELVEPLAQDDVLKALAADQLTWVPPSEDPADVAHGCVHLPSEVLARGLERDCAIGVGVVGGGRHRGGASPAATAASIRLFGAGWNLERGLAQRREQSRWGLM